MRISAILVLVVREPPPIQPANFHTKWCETGANMNTDTTIDCICFRCDGYALTACLNGRDRAEHAFDRTRFAGTLICTKCGLLPLDDDDMRTDCEPKDEA